MNKNICFSGNIHIDETRAQLWEEYTKNFNDDERKLLTTLTGRNSELAHNALYLCKLLDINLLDSIKKLIKNKVKLESVGEHVYLELLKQCLRDIYNRESIAWLNEDNFKYGTATEREQDKNKALSELNDAPKVWTLCKGDYEKKKCCARHEAYLLYTQLLRKKNVLTIGSPKFHSYLKDLGFIEEETMRNQKMPGNNNSVRCLIFDEKILENIGVTNALKVSEEDIE